MADCNYVVTDARGEITSPNYPGKYSSNLTDQNGALMCSKYKNSKKNI